MFVSPFLVYSAVKKLLSDYDERNRSLQIAPLETRKSELENKLLKAKDKQNEFYTNMEEELKNEKDPEKLETLLQKKYMSILGLIIITKTGKESKKENFTLDIQELEEYLRQKKRVRNETQWKKSNEKIKVQNYFDDRREKIKKKEKDKFKIDEALDILDRMIKKDLDRDKKDRTSL